VRPYERLLSRPKYVKQGRARVRAKLPPSTSGRSCPSREAFEYVLGDVEVARVEMKFVLTF
jgi:hypothetical protein